MKLVERETILGTPAIVSEAPGERHVVAWMKIAQASAALSRCPRHRIGCVILDPVNNTPVLVTYNGPPMGEAPDGLCGGGVCDRDRLGIPSGERYEVGCRHAESNAVALAARTGRSLAGLWALVTGEPCLTCARDLHHAGISRVCILAGGYAGPNGIRYLSDHGVDVSIWGKGDGPRQRS